MQCSSFHITGHRKLMPGTRKWEGTKESRGDKCAKGILRWPMWLDENENLPISEKYYAKLDPEGLGGWIG